MANNAIRDQNAQPTLLARSSTDEEIVVPLEANGTTNRLLTEATVSGGMGKLVTEDFDYIAATYPTATTETYTYKSGGSGGTTVATVAVVYTDSTKENISTVTKT